MSPGSSRIDPLPEGDARTAAEECGIPAFMTSLSVFQVLLKNPTVAKPVHDLITTLLFKGSLDARLRELVIMRTGWVTASMYEWTQHWKIAQTLGVEERDLLAVRDWRDAPEGTFSPAEQAALAAVDDIAGAGCVSSGTWGEITQTLGDESLAIELIALCSTYAMVSTALRSLDVPLEEGVDPWPPDGAHPGEEMR